MDIRKYESRDEIGWIRCRVLSFLDTAYYDNVLKEKETYEHPSIELIAEIDHQIVGLLDIEYETAAGTVCSDEKLRSGMIWHLAVHPDHQRKGIAYQLLNTAKEILKGKNIERIEAWTRDDKWVNEWYESQAFYKKSSYYHVYMEGDQELNEWTESTIPKLYPISTFAHYVGGDIEMIKQKFNRVHEYVMFELLLNKS